MKLSIIQWEVLTKAGATKGGDVLSNTSTMASLATKGLITFKGSFGNERMVTTKLGATFLFLRRTFQKIPSFNQNRKLISQRYR